MTNHWIDIKNSDVIMIIGSNAAENHPISFKWVQKALDKGGKLIVVDPRYTRSASKASVVDGMQLYSQMRSGTDIPFMMGMMKYAMDNNRINWDYVKSCTNASFLINSAFETCRDTSVIPSGTGTGTFSGLQASAAAHKQWAYDKTTWGYQYVDSPTNLQPAVDTNLGTDSVWKLLEAQLAPYTLAAVSNVTGADQTVLEKIYEVYTSTYLDEKSACIMYAMGSTQHTYGTQNVRSYAMMQLLLGNVGVAGGGINALRGESNVQGSTDMCLLWHILPGYLAATTTAPKHATRAAYKNTYSSGKSQQDITPVITPGPDQTGNPISLAWWRFGGKYLDSLLQAWWPVEHTGDANLDTAYGYLPKAVSGTAYSHIDIFEAMHVGDIKGLMCWGQNPAVGGPNSSFERNALENLEWLVSVDLWETETAAFWKRPGATPGSISTVVYQLPAAASYEKEGSITNSGRWSQWRYKAMDPPGDALDDLEILNRLGKKLISLYQTAGRSVLNDPLCMLYWGPYPGVDAHLADCRPVAPLWATNVGGNGQGYDDSFGHADPHRVAWEINGYFCPTSTTGTPGFRVDGFWGTNPLATLQEDGKTSSGNWLYCSHYVNPGDWINCFDGSATTPNGNRQENRINIEKFRGDGKYIGLYSNWSVCWPLNRRIIYNGASVYQTGHSKVGEPLAPDKWVLDFGVGGTGGTGPDANGSDVSDGFTAPGGVKPRYAFIMHREGHAHLFGPGRADGPFPEHYEPFDTPLTTNPLPSDTTHNPTLHAHARAWGSEYHTPGDPEFPIVGTTYRVSEHWQAGQMTRNNPWLCQLIPDVFVELSEELAITQDIVNGDAVQIKTMRTNLHGKRMLGVACVTKRFKPYNVAGGVIHHIGTIWHFGYTGCCTGDSANLLTPHVGDANTGIPESKAFTCNIRKFPGGAWLT